MSIGSMTVYRITNVEFIPTEASGLHWVKMKLLDAAGKEDEIDIFFERDHQHEMFLEQIGQKVLA